MKIKAHGKVYALRVAYRPPRRWAWRPAYWRDAGRDMGKALTRGISACADISQALTEAVAAAREVA